jgi:hypothetical protein
MFMLIFVWYWGIASIEHIEVRAMILSSLAHGTHFCGIYAIQTLEQGNTRVQPQQLPKRAEVQDSYTENPELVTLRNVFMALRRLAKRGKDAGKFQLEDKPDSRVYSPEDVFGPYLYSTENVILTNDAKGNHITAWQEEVESPSQAAANAQIRSGKVTKAPPGYAVRRQSTEGFFNQYLPAAVPVSVRIESSQKLTIAPTDSTQPAFDLTV